MFNSNQPPSLIDQNDSWDLQVAYLQKKLEELQQKSANGDTQSRQVLPFWENGLKNAQGWAAQRGFNNWQPGSTGRPQSNMTPGLANMMMGYLGSDLSDPQAQRMKEWASSQPAFSLSHGARLSAPDNSGDSLLADPRVHRALLDTHNPMQRLQDAGFGDNSQLMGLARGRNAENLNLQYGLGGAPSNFGIRGASSPDNTYQMV